MSIPPGSPIHHAYCTLAPSGRFCWWYSEIAMTKAVQLGLTIALAAGVALGQRPGGMHLGNSLGNPLPPLSPIPPLVTTPRPQFAPQRVPQRGFRTPGYFPLPYLYSDAPYYPATYSVPAAEPGPPVTIIQQFGAPAQASGSQQPPVTPEVHEYSAPPESSTEPATFTIVLKNGSVVSASAAFVQGAVLQIVDPDGQHRRIELDSIDRETTRRRNAERNLRLQLQ